MAGVIIVPNKLKIGRAISDLEIMIGCLSAKELTDKTEYLPL
jgi:hypothetical protein